MRTVQAGVSAKSKRALSLVAVAGLAGLAFGQAAAAEEQAAAGEAVPTAELDRDARGFTEVSSVDVHAARRKADSPKYTAALRDTPQTITVVPRGVIEAQNLLSLRDVLSTVPGITFGAGEGGGGYGDSINLRGYTASNDITLDGVRDSAQYTRSDPFNIEQIEVTNGANSVYSGAGSVGGTINLVSKRPTMHEAKTASVGIGTDNYRRATIDSNILVGDGIAVRLNAMAHRNDAPGRDVEKARRWGIAPSITVGLDGPTQFTAMYVHQQDINTPQYGVPFFNGKPLPGVDPSAYYGYANVDTQKSNLNILTGIIDHRFSDSLQVHNLTRWQKVTQLSIVDPPQGTWCLANGLKPVAWSQSTTSSNVSGFAPCVAGDPAPGFYQPSGPRGNLRSTRNTLLYSQTDFTLDFDTAGLHHRMVVGAAFTEEKFRLETGRLFTDANGAPVSLPAMSIANPNNIYSGAFNFTQGTGAAPSGTPLAFPYGGQDGKRSNQAVYLFDNVEFSSQWSFNFGLRWEHNEGENYQSYYTSAGYLPNPSGGSAPGPASAGAPGGVFSGVGPVGRNEDDLFSYRFGLVYKPAPNASLYIAYANSETPSQATVNGAGCGANCDVDPEKAESYEIGAKWDVMHGRLSLTGAVFRNDRTNYKVASGDPTLPAQVLDGSARVDGVALGASGRLSRRWSVFANYTYLHSKVLQGVSDVTASQGLDFTKGDPLTNVPDHAFSLFTTYDLPHHVQVGYGVTYQGRYYLTQHAQITGSNPPARTTIPLVRADDYWVHRTTVAWSPTRAIELRLNVNNLFDKQYYQRGRNNGWATPGDRRNTTLTLNYRF